MKIFIYYDWNEFFIISGDNESHESRIHLTIVCRAGGLWFPAGVSWFIPSSADRFNITFCLWFVCLNLNKGGGGLIRQRALIQSFTIHIRLKHILFKCSENCYLGLRFNSFQENESTEIKWKR